MPDLLSSALAYTARGWPVFLLYEPFKATCRVMLHSLLVVALREFGGDA